MLLESTGMMPKPASVQPVTQSGQAPRFISPDDLVLGPDRYRGSQPLTFHQQRSVDGREYQFPIGSDGQVTIFRYGLPCYGPAGYRGD